MGLINISGLGSKVAANAINSANRALRQTILDGTTVHRTEKMPRLLPELTSPTMIGDIMVDATTSRQADYNSEVTNNPVEDGFAVSDHVRRKPIPLKITAVFTPTPVTWADSSSGVDRMREVFTGLQAIYEAGEPITIKTIDFVYSNMVMIGAPIKRDKNRYAYELDLTFQQVRVAQRKTAATDGSDASDEASGTAGQSAQDTGRASQQDIGTGMKYVGTVQTIDVDTGFLDKANNGNVVTGWELSATQAVLGLATCYASKALGGIKL